MNCGISWDERFRSESKRPLLVSLVSFGYKYGVPTDADLMFDVRFLPNPHFVPKLRAFYGPGPESPAVHPVVSADRGISSPHAEPLTYLIPHYIEEETLSHHRLRLHRREASLGDDGRVAEEGSREA